MAIVNAHAFQLYLKGKISYSQMISAPLHPVK